MCFPTQDPLLFSFPFRVLSRPTLIYFPFPSFFPPAEPSWAPLQRLLGGTVESRLGHGLDFVASGFCEDKKTLPLLLPIE